MNEIRILFRQFRFRMGFWRDKDYLSWGHEYIGNHLGRFPTVERNKKFDLHHLLGTTTAKKYTDYCVYPFEHYYHLNVVEKNEAKFFFEYVRESFTLLYIYGKDIVNCDIKDLNPLKDPTDPGQWIRLIELIREEKNGREINPYDRKALRV